MRRTNNDIFRQLEELKIENEQLKEVNKNLLDENRWLRAENTRLKQRLKTMEATMEECINKAVEEAVAKAVAPLLETIEEKEGEILRLKSQIAKNSSNSSKPSGNNGFKQIPNNREKSSKKRGGQSGHKGNRLDIPKNLDELVEQGLAEHVIVSDVADSEVYVSDWTVDVKIITVYTEFHRSPGKPPVIEYGPQLKAQAVYSREGKVRMVQINLHHPNVPMGQIPRQMKPHLQTTKQNVIYVIVKLGRKYQDVSAVGREFSTIVR